MIHGLIVLQTNIDEKQLVWTLGLLTWAYYLNMRNNNEKTRFVHHYPYDKIHRLAWPNRKTNIKI